MSMFCNQCQETLNNTGCLKAGVCGKSEPVSNLQDLLLYMAKGLAYVTKKAGDSVDTAPAKKFIVKALFTTITNVNFDEDRMMVLLEECAELRDDLVDMIELSDNAPDAVTWQFPDSKVECLRKAEAIQGDAGENPDLHSVKNLILYGLKGVAAYDDHAQILGFSDPEVDDFIVEAMAALLNPSPELNDLLALTMKTGDFSVKVMALLDKANTETYGNPEPTAVFTGLKDAPGILVSGHDLLDLYELLQQTQGKGINVYTHGEMLPCNAYPKLKEFDHLVGNYGTSWYNQQKEFDSFGGPIVMTTNCIQKPLDSYAGRIYTTGVVAFPNTVHIEDREQGAQKDWSPVIEKALACGNLTPVDGKDLTIGFAHHTLTSVAGQVVEAVKSGAIKRFIVMAGCDGRQKDREYFTEVAKRLPKDTVILTAGCAKYRYNHLELGDIGGIPRLIDAGQCNDSYSLAVIALKLKEVFEVESLNDLPISFDIGWYEQKAVCVLLALLALGVKGIRLGPTLPGFLTANVAAKLVELFDIKPISSVDQDITDMLAGR